MLTIPEVCDAYESATAKKVRLLIKKQAFPGAKKIKNKWHIPDDEAARVFIGKEIESNSRKVEAADLNQLKAEKTLEEITKLKLQREETINKIRAMEKTEFERLFSLLLVDLIDWPNDLNLTEEQREVWNQKLKSSAEMIEREGLKDRMPEIMAEVYKM